MTLYVENKELSHEKIEQKSKLDEISKQLDYHKKRSDIAEIQRNKLECIARKFQKDKEDGEDAIRAETLKRFRFPFLRYPVNLTFRENLCKRFETTFVDIKKKVDFENGEKEKKMKEYTALKGIPH